MAFLAPLPRAARPSKPAAAPARRGVPRATIAAPKTPRSTPPPPRGDEHARQPAAAPWMPLPGVVHELLTPEQYDRLACVAAQSGHLLVVDFMAAWCRKCIYLLPKLRKLAKARPETYFCAVDVNKVHRLPREFEIKNMPTFVLVRDGREVGRFVGGAAPGKVAKQLEDVVDKFVTEGAGGSS